MWLLLACLGYALLAVVSLLDKIVVSREKITPLQFAFYSTIIVAPFIFATPFIPAPITGWQWFAVLSGSFSYGLALYCMYRSFAAGEVSHNGPLIGAITPLCTFIIALLILPEPFTPKQLAAIGLLILGSLVITFTKNRTMKDWHGSVIFSFLAAFFFATFFIASKYAYDMLGFGTGFIWILAGMGIFGILLFLGSASLRQSLYTQRRKPAKQNKRLFSIFAIDKIGAGAGVVLIQYALSQGSPTIINALTGLQYAILIVLVAIITKLWPKLYTEEYDHGELLQELVAVVIIGCGLALLV